MALGLGLGLHKGQIVGDTCFGTLGETQKLLHIPNLVGWWDFSDVSQLYQSIDTSSAVSAAGQNIRRVNNKAQNNERLGNFMRSGSGSSASWPDITYQTNGAGGRSYAFKGDGNPSPGYLQSSRNAGFGGVSDGSTFSNLTWNNNDFTVISVIDLLTTAEDAQRFWSLTGNHADDSLAAGLNKLVVRYDPEKIRGEQVVGTNSGAIDAITSVETEVGEKATMVVSYLGGSGTNASQLRINAGQSDIVNGTIDPANTYNLSGTYGMASLFTLAANPGGGSSSSDIQNVDMYEHIVYSRKLSVEELDCVESYLMNKYEILSVLDDLVGWWDFTDRRKMFQSRAGTDAVTADNDPIGYIKNLANGSSGNKLGAFMRSESDLANKRPIFKTGGANGKSYAQFNDADNNRPNCGLRAGYFTTADADDDGGVSATKFSDLVMTSQNMTTFAVVQNDVVDTTGSRYVLTVYGHTATADTDVGSFQSTKQNDDTFESRWLNTGSTTEDVTTSSAIDTNLNLITTIGDSGTNAAKLEFNGSVQDSETLDSNFTINLTKQSNNTTGRPFVNLGCLTSLDTGATSLSWTGKIYEVLVFNKTLSASEITNIKAYFRNKYGLAIA